ncbi:MAG: hypothetical protein DA407_05560 [Bacteroidetes bacterium]|nr:MAG: hypothetical protein DA407_05560 [Bacteroidota bacterium]
MNISWKIKRVLIKNRLFFYLTGFVIVLTFTAFLTDKFLRDIDFNVYKSLYFNSQYSDFNSNNILIVDLPAVQGEPKINYRKRIGKLLDTINQMSSNLESIDRPEVILDFSFDENGVEDTLFIESIKSLKKNDVEVYGVYDVVEKNDGFFDGIEKIKIYDLIKNENNRDSELYGNFSKGRLHTMVNVHSSGIIWYDSYIKFEDSINNITIKVVALPLQVPNPKSKYKDEPVSTFILPYGSQENLKTLTWTYKHNDDESSQGDHTLLNINPAKEINIKGKFIVIGDLDNDQVKINDKTTIPGPYLLSWALLDQIEGNKLAKQPINNMWIQFLIALSCIVFIALFFDWIFKRVKKLQTQPLLLAIISFFAGLLILTGIIYVMPGNKIIRPGFPVLSMFLVTIFIWQYKKKFIKLGIIDGGETYDIFISYSRKQGKWVKKNVYLPLKGFKNSEDNKLNIFFDEESIPPGEQFQDFYKEAILNSKIFLPVFSEDYFKSNHCTEEIKFAELRKTETKNTETNFRIYPLAFNFDVVPKKHTDINIVQIDDKNSFMKGLKEALYKA